MTAVLTDDMVTSGDPGASEDYLTASAPGMNTSVGKALAVLDAFRGDGVLLGVSQIAARAHLPKSTAHRLLADLVDHGYVERVDARYRLGRAIFELGNMVPDCRPRSLRTVAMPYMTSLLEATHTTVHLAVLDGNDVLYVDKIYGHESVELPSRVGGRVPALCTALGKAIVSHSATDVRERVLGRPVPRLTPRTVVNPAVLRVALNQARETGVAEDTEGASLGSRCIASPIIDRSGNVLGAVSLSARTTDRFPPNYVQVLRRSTALVGASF